MMYVALVHPHVRDWQVRLVATNFNFLSGIRLISKSTVDAQEAAALNYKYNENHIYTNSWGPIDDGRRLEGPGRLATLALQTGVISTFSFVLTIYRLNKDETEKDLSLFGLEAMDDVQTTIAITMDGQIHASPFLLVQ
jgi:hypothetical protein